MKTNMTAVQIQLAQNGFVVTESREMHSVSAAPFVFETFAAMSSWLEQQLVPRPYLAGRDCFVEPIHPETRG